MNEDRGLSEEYNNDRCHYVSLPCFVSLYLLLYCNPGIGQTMAQHAICPCSPFNIKRYKTTEAHHCWLVLPWLKLKAFDKLAVPQAQN